MVVLLILIFIFILNFILTFIFILIFIFRSRGIARPANVVNSTVTDSFALLKSVGFDPSAILDVGAFSGEFSRSAERWFPEAEIFLIESSEDRRDDLMKTGNY